MTRAPNPGRPKRAGRYHHGDLREALLAAALQVVEEQGLEQLTLRELARRLGVSHAAPAHHFPDKQALLTALAIAGFERFVRELEKAAARERLPEARLAAMGRAYVHFAMEHSGFFRVMFAGPVTELQQGSAELAQAVGAAHSALERAVAEVVREGDPARIASAALAAWSFVHGAATLHLDGAMRFPSGERPNARELDRWLDGMLPLLARALVAAPP